MEYEVKGKQAIEQSLRGLRLATNNMKKLIPIFRKIQKTLKKDCLGIIYNKKIYMVSAGKIEVSDNFIEQVEDVLKINGDKFESHRLLADNNGDKLFFSNEVAGLLIRKALNVPNLFVFFAAREIEKEVKWGGQPDIINIVDNNGVVQLEPRNSFLQWKETVRGQSKEWSKGDRELLISLLGSIEACILYNKNEEIKRKLHKSSYRDTLTGLANRLYLSEYIENFSLRKRNDNYISVFF